MEKNYFEFTDISNLDDQFEVMQTLVECEKQTNKSKINHISNGYEDISVEVVDYNRQIAEHAWNCYKMTWKNLQDVNYNCDDTNVIKAIQNIIDFKALPMPREQALITFRINNISRVCLAQITRQRESAFNVESQMPRPVEHNVIMPLNVEKLGFKDKAEKLIKMSQSLYDEMINAGMPPQDARYLLMHGQTTSCVYVVNINKFVSSFGLRCENNLSDEINLVYRLAKKAILNTIAKDYRSGKIDKLTYNFYYSIISKADASGAANKVGKNYDEVFGNSFKRYPDANKEITNITENCSYDFKKSAWRYELERLKETKPELLFDNESEMIYSWIS